MRKQTPTVPKQRAQYINTQINRIYNKILDRDWFYAHLFVT